MPLYSLFVYHDFRRTLNDVLTIMMLRDSSSEEDSSDSDDDLHLILLETLFPTIPKGNTHRLKLEDLSESQCLQMFR